MLPEWDCNDAQWEIYRMWKKFKKTLTSLILQKLKIEKAPFFDYEHNFNNKHNIIRFEPDWNALDDWNILTVIKRSYSKDGIINDSEKMYYMAGKIFLHEGMYPYKPSFKFIFNLRKSVLTIDMRAVFKLFNEELALEEPSSNFHFKEDKIPNFISIDESEANLSKENREILYLTFERLGFKKKAIEATIREIQKDERFDPQQKVEEMVRIGLSLQKTP